jgi:5-methylcytosine-specific restriction endonuclease McrA
MSLIIQDAAHPLDTEFATYDFENWLTFSELHDTYVKIHTVKHAIAVPEIIVLRKYDRLPVRDVKYSRQTLFQRDKFHCAYCNNMFDRNELTVDHIIPRCRGGTSNWSNTVSACRPCNALKADRTPEQAGMILHIKPRKPVWLSPIADVRPDHPCKSWRKFMDRTLVDNS